MARRLPPLNSLRAFEAAARLGSFTLAADELCVTHGAISRHVQQLETWLGKPLFERLNRRVVLTDAGRTYLAEVGASFDRIALATAQQFGQGQQRVLRVNAPATFSLRWLVPKLSSFQVAHPTIEVRLSTSNEPIDKLRDSADLIIRGGPQTIDGYMADEFLSEVRLPVCAPKLLERTPLRAPADLANFTLLHAATYPGMWPEWLAAAGCPNLAPRHALTLEHFYLTLQGALDGLGVAMGPIALVADDIADGRLVQPFSGPALPAWRYFTYVSATRIDDEAVRAFRDWLKLAGRAERSDGLR
ncbi:transcriptional regulator GcvA [Burkholderia multivorans]|uniref:transcriptional regulator GcvA n=1 Tax=Burkholderia multivorans TaxID=87883 RepID=UPI00084125F9|nr:transcriptional regulator GcvA [Burkholderia multivorans]AOJ96705.1 transcriptional regulator [Burkholderia multivorans]MBU9240066.1 transcriptional regulator GcvA [Burkholderia multivorans]MCO1344965.1 transcriptional regulator GcvA [Burkholderia multivorans]MCO1444849.1 transcriptional regulator GcvA [Burkholderia multivorans]MDR8751009.1 Glycine cleavage system transcriptional activator [Burkholderia multivorans]